MFVFCICLWRLRDSRCLLHDLRLQTGTARRGRPDDGGSVTGSIQLHRAHGPHWLQTETARRGRPDDGGSVTGTIQLHRAHGPDWLHTETARRGRQGGCHGSIHLHRAHGPHWLHQHMYN